MTIKLSDLTADERNQFVTETEGDKPGHGIILTGKYYVAAYGGYHPCRCGNHCKNNPDSNLAAGFCNHPGMREGIQHVFGRITKEQYALICVMGCYTYDGPARELGW